MEPVYLVRASSHSSTPSITRMGSVDIKDTPIPSARGDQGGRVGINGGASVGLGLALPGSPLPFTSNNKNRQIMPRTPGGGMNGGTAGNVITNSVHALSGIGRQNGSNINGGGTGMSGSGMRGRRWSRTSER